MVSRSRWAREFLTSPLGLHGRLSGLLLGALLVLTAVGAMTFDRREWTALIGDEATYLMTAESLAWDGDLLYSAADYRRFIEHWEMVPEGLILQSGDRGQHITFGKPFFYPLYIAPFVRLAPRRGPFVANVLILALACALTVRTLQETIGPAASLWVAVFVFGSVAFAYSFWAHADLFLMSITAVAMALAFRGAGSSTGLRGRRWAGEHSSRRWDSARWGMIGALVAMVVFSRPFYLPLFLPVVFVLVKRSRRRSAVALIVGAATLALLAGLVHHAYAGDWTSYGAQRRGFYAATGFPEIDFPAGQWASSFEDLPNAAWAEAESVLSLPRTDARLWLWNGIYFVLGRHVGLLPYFLPALAVLLAPPLGLKRWSICLAVALSISAFFLYRPFNFYGGGGAIANRYFLPLYPLLWFLVPSRLSSRRAVLSLAVAAPFLWPLWMGPRAEPLRSNHTYRYVSSTARMVLPYETTQSHLKPGGRSDVVHGGLWVKFLDPSIRPNRRGDELLLDRGQRGQLLVGSSQPLDQLVMRIRADPAESIEVIGGASVLQSERLADGNRLTIGLDRARARHPMWWTWDTVHLYQVTLQSSSPAPGRISFTLRPGTSEPASSSE